MISVLEKIFPINRIQLLNVFKDGNDTVYTLMTLLKRKNELQLVSKDCFFAIEDLYLKLSVKYPLLLLVDGKGVVSKRIDFSSQSDLEWYKNLDYTSIHCTSFKNETYEFISFCRKETVAEIYESFIVKGYTVLDVYVGPITGHLLREELQADSVVSNQSMLNYQNGQLTEVSKSLVNSDLQSVGSLKLNSYEIALYGLGIVFFVNDMTFSTTVLSNQPKEELFFQKAFEKFGVFTLGIFFCSLLVSYISIQYLITANAQLSLENSYSSKSFDKIQLLEKERSDKIKILNETGFSSRQLMTFFCDEISRDIPEDLRLNFLEVSPLLTDVKNDKKIELGFRTLLLRGQALDKIEFNDWVALLRENYWVELLEIVSIKKDKKGTTFFEIKITIKDV